MQNYKAVYETMTAGNILEHGAEQVPDKTAVICNDISKTYKELNHMADSLAAAVADLGYKKGDRVAIYMKNSIEFMAAFYALQKIGVIAAWVNALYRESESEFIINNSESKGVFIFNEWQGYDYLDAVKKIRDRSDTLEHIFVVGDEDGNGIFSFDGLIKSGAGKKVIPPEIDTKNDLSMFIYTSGTTGNPKGAMLTHYQVVMAGQGYANGVGAGGDDIFIGVLPMSHSYGCGAGLIQPLLLQSTIVLEEAYNVEETFKLIEKYKVTIQNASPVHYILELNHPKRKEYDLGSLRAGLIAGQPAPTGLITQVEKEMDMYLTSFWGASEVGPGNAIVCPYPSDLETREKYIGIPIEGTQVKVVDPETRAEVENGTDGELILSGWHVLKGYWNNEKETKSQIVDGWLYTGDLVRKDNNGFYQIFGRTKDLINRGGYKIYPLELESLINDHPKVEQSCVVPTPNPVLGENICACVKLHKGENICISEIRSFLECKVANHKLPNELCIMEDIPKLPGGVKVKKFGPGGAAELAANDPNREIHKKK